MPATVAGTGNSSSADAPGAGFSCDVAECGLKREWSKRPENGGRILNIVQNIVRTRGSSPISFPCSGKGALGRRQRNADRWSNAVLEHVLWVVLVPLLIPGRWAGEPEP